MGVSKNSGTPKWMVKIMENPIKMDDLGGPPLFGNTQMFWSRNVLKTKLLRPARSWLSAMPSAAPCELREETHGVGMCQPLKPIGGTNMKKQINNRTFRKNKINIKYIYIDNIYIYI